MFPRVGNFTELIHYGKRTKKKILVDFRHTKRQSPLDGLTQNHYSYYGTF